jgi:sugar-specific transcriptional regulator TrmB
MNLKILEKIGLTGNEIKIYLALLELGSVKAGEIIKKTKLHRSRVYDNLDRLIEKGIVSYVIKANRRYFEATPPENLISFMEKKEDEIKEDKEKVKKMIPELDALRILSKAEQDVTLFKGYKGIQSALGYLLKAKEIFSLGGYSEDAEGLKYCLKFMLPRIHAERIKRKIPIKFVFPKGSKKRADELKKLSYTKVRLLDDKFASLTGIQIFDENVLIILWSINPIAILIKSKEIADSYKQYFDYLWNQSKEYN